jgi:hypothetical protein
LIGRRLEVTRAVALLEHRPVDPIDARGIGGVVLTGVGGIGKSAIAGRVIHRLRDRGWCVAVHEGSWNPQALFAAAARALGGLEPAVAAVLASTADDQDRLDVLATALEQNRLLLVFDDFEQNLTPTGGAFRDLAGAESLVGRLVDRLALAAARAPVDAGGGLLVTSRYRLPDPFGVLLPQIEVPRLNAPELRRLLLRLPALTQLKPDEHRVVVSTIGGHPRLIEFVDAILRGGRSDLADVTIRLRQLAQAEGIPIDDPPPSIDAAVETTLTLGAGDILFDALLGELTVAERIILDHTSVCRMPLPARDLALSVRPVLAGEATEATLVPHLERLRRLTLLDTGHDAYTIPSIAELVRQRATPKALAELHQHAAGMHRARSNQGNFTAADAVDLPFHLAGAGNPTEAAEAAIEFAKGMPNVLQRVAYLNEVFPAIPETDWAWSVLAHEIAEAYTDMGDLATAREALNAAMKRCHQRAQSDPTNTQWQRDLSVSHNNLGDLAIAQGDTPSAHTHYHAALNIRERLTQSDPTNTQWQRELEIIRKKVESLP